MNLGLYDNPDAQPVEIHPHYIKLYILCGIFAVLGALCIRGALSATEASARGMLGLLAVAMLFAVHGLWKRARSGAPTLVISAEGIEDHRHGFIPWSQISRWRHSTGLLNPGFGWNLKEGTLPPRNPTLFRLFAAFNWFGGLGQRTYRRKMILGGLEPMAAAFRQFHPSAEAKR